VRRAGVALVQGHVVDGDRRSGIVVGDRPRADRGGDGRVVGVRQRHAIGLVRLVEHVALQRDRDRLGRRPGGERERAGGRRVVRRSGGGQVAGRVVHRDGLAARRGQGGGERGRRGAGVHLGDG